MGVQSLTGHVLGQYELRELLGVGGMGAVYRAYQITLKRQVAIKVLPLIVAAQPGYAERFNREAEMSAALEHPHIIPIYDYGMLDGVSYIVMRLLTGGTLAERIDQRSHKVEALPSLGETAELLRQLASALDYAHSQGVIHRDIKPSNVMFDNQGSAYIVDFGIAKLVESTKSLTTSGVMLGTPVYMAPEQWTAEPVTPATDEYVLAGMIYTLVSGHPPFEASTPYALMHKHLIEPITPVRHYRPAVPESVQAVLEVALAKDPEERYPSTLAFAQAFTEVIRGYEGTLTGFFTAPIQHKTLPQIGATPLLPRRITDQTPLFTKRRVLRRPLAWIVMVPILALLAVLVALAFPRGPRDSTPEDRPNAQTQATLSVLVQEQTQSALHATQTALSADAEQMVWQTVTAVRLTEVASLPSSTPAPSHTPTLRPSSTAGQTDTPVPSHTPMLRPSSTARQTDTPTRTPPASTTPGATLTPTRTPSLTATRDRQGTLEAQNVADAVESVTPAPTETPASTLTPTGEAVPVALASSGGGQIAFVSDRDRDAEIYVMNADGSAITQLTRNSASDESPAWSPDGSQIVFVSDRDGDREIYLMNADGSDIGQLTDSRGEDVFDPVWSPDGSQIAFVSNRDGGAEIYVMETNGSNVRRLTADDFNDSDLAWSPDGGQIAFVSDRDGSAEIYVMDANGSSIRRLTDNAADEWTPAWSPDGSQIAFVSLRDGPPDIYVMDTDGEHVTRLTALSAVDEMPAWSPDGSQIAFMSSRDGSDQIYVMEADGSNVRRLTDDQASALGPAWRPGSGAMAGEQVSCTVITAQEGVKVRVGPGRTRGEFKDLPVDQPFSVIGKAKGGDGSLWWKLDRNQFSGGQNAISLWVAEADVTENGDCILVADTEIPPIVYAPPLAAPTNSPAELPAAEAGQGGAAQPPSGPQPTAPPGQPTYTPIPPPPVVCFSVSVQADPSSAGSASILTAANCNSQYRGGTAVTFSATPLLSDSAFDHWSGCGSGSANPISVTITGNCTMVAHFRS